MPVDWKDRGLVCVKYVDDCLSIERLCFSGAEHFNANGETYALARAIKSQSLFNTIEFNAAQRGMIVNNNKTKMMCISAARTYVPASYIITTSGERIDTDKTMKILGFHFDTTPTVKYHLKLLHRRFKSRVWALRHLKINGFKQNELVRVYKMMIRPVAEYCSSVFHSMITQSDSLELERIQMQALKRIYGWRLSYSTLLEKSGVERLDERRKNRFLELAKKMP